MIRPKRLIKLLNGIQNFGELWKGGPFLALNAEFSAWSRPTVNC